MNILEPIVCYDLKFTKNNEVMLAELLGDARSALAREQRFALGKCVVAVYSRDIAETKAKEAIDLAKQAGFPLMFITEPEN